MRLCFPTVCVLFRVLNLCIPYLVIFLCVMDLMSVLLPFFFFFKGKLPTTGMTITKLEDSENHKNAFEISGIDHKYFLCLLFTPGYAILNIKCSI